MPSEHAHACEDLLNFSYVLGMNIDKILNNPTQIIALTSLTRDEFELLLAPFSQQWRKWYKHYDFRLKRRNKPLTGGQLEKPTKTLPTVQDKLFFILYHFKNNHLQQDLAAIFDMDQGQVSKWIKILEPVLEQAIKQLGVQPARNLGELTKLFGIRQRNEQLPNDKPQARTLGADATDRPIGRNTDYDTQKEYYSGKHRKHTVKNTILADEYQFIHFLGIT